MSVDATRWAWKVDVSSSTKRLVLLALADRAGEEHTCYPSAVRMTKDTNLNRKTVLTAINDLIKDGLVLDTGERKGNGVRVLKLVGVHGRENETHPKKLTDTKNGTSAEIGMASSTEIGMTTDTKNGIQNLKGNLTKNLTKNYSEAFEKFWSEYPSCKRKGTRDVASKTFKKYEKDFELIMKVLSLFKVDEMWTKNAGQFISAPSVWLNAQHWKAEYWLNLIGQDVVTESQQVNNAPLAAMYRKKEKSN